MRNNRECRPTRYAASAHDLASPRGHARIPAPTPDYRAIHAPCYGSGASDKEDEIIRSPGSHY